MNIVFVYCENQIPHANSTGWRGKTFYSAINKTGLHQVVLVKYSDVINQKEKAITSCQESQLIILEGSTHFDMLNVINFWKSRGKKVVVDIPLTHESSCNEHFPSPNNTLPISKLFSRINEQRAFQIDQIERFRWGLHLADCIIVSSLHAQSHWQSTAPIKLIKDFIDLDSLQDIVKIKHEELIIGLFYDTSPVEESFQLLLNLLIENHSNVKWYPLGQPQLLFGISPDAIYDKFPPGQSIKWPGPLSLIDMAIFWDSKSNPGDYYQTILEVMSKKIPWILNTGKGYKEIEKYGLIVQNQTDWKQKITEFLQNSRTLGYQENGYLFSIGLNIDDHVHEILATYSEIIKNSG